MKRQSQIVEIDALAAFKKIGVHLEDSPIGSQCAEAFKAQLLAAITTELLLQSIMDANKRPKKFNRGCRKSDSASEIGTEEGVQ